MDLDSLDLASLRARYVTGRFTPIDLVRAIAERMAAATDPAIFITTVQPDAMMAAAQALLQLAPEPNSLPLWGVPFAVKDNIDVANLPTTAACPAFAYTPLEDATVVKRLLAAGAILIGKTNLDQFATGLNGTRSPYGVPRSVFDPAYISGGSSSGSAVAVASGLASFALGTDTAGSGRIPAAFNNLVGIKPTQGLLSTTGVVPACRSLDCVTILANTVADGLAIRHVAEAFDEADPFSRPATHRDLPAEALRVGVLEGPEREFFGDPDTEHLYEEAIGRARGLGATIVPFDYAPFREAAALLYNGPWVAERLAAIALFMDTHADEVEPSVRTIIEGARQFSGVDVFQGRYELEQLRRRTDAEWAKLDVLLLPTAPTTYTVEAMLADPINLNSRLGLYTNFVNLLDCSAIAVPAGFGASGLPAGVTVVGRAFEDDALALFADGLHRASGAGMGATRKPLPDIRPQPATPEDYCPIVVVGAHLSGMPLNHELVERGGRLLKATKTAADYRLFALSEARPPKPGLVHEPGFGGPGLDVEVWTLPPAEFGRFVTNIPAPLGIGKIALEDGSAVSGFLCETYAVAGAEDITHLGGWRAYLDIRV